MKVDDAYKDNVGRPAVERYPEGDPARAQWDYTGTLKEKQRLLEDLGVVRDEQQEKLF